MRTDRVYTVREIATILKVSEKTIYQLIHSHDLPCLWVRGQIRVTAKQLDQYMEGEDSRAKRSKRNLV